MLPLFVMNTYCGQTVTLLSGEKVEIEVEGAEVTSAGSNIVHEASIIYTNYRLICAPSSEKNSASIFALVDFRLGPPFLD
jgi:phage-related protein